jgi:hypothetical protein
VPASTIEDHHGMSKACPRESGGSNLTADLAEIIFHPAAICRAAIAETTDLGLVDEFRMVSAFARRPVNFGVA